MGARRPSGGLGIGKDVERVASQNGQGGGSLRRARGWGMPNGVVAAALLVWGASLALQGLGLGATAAADALSRWWPGLFVAMGVAGLLSPRRVGGARSFSAALAGGSLVLLAGAIAVPGFNGSDVVWAAVIVSAGVWVAARRSWWQW